ncbi:hypothetical protein [Streptomyces sp. NPDC050738]|uniref:hypothetical protein n=1 Tax=Streptomyces sp. NPDC050738 TaxID=3154744 RepID=UPI003422C621
MGDSGAGGGGRGAFDDLVRHGWRELVQDVQQLGGLTPEAAAEAVTVVMGKLRADRERWPYMLDEFDAKALRDQVVCWARTVKEGPFATRLWEETFLKPRMARPLSGAWMAPLEAEDALSMSIAAVYDRWPTGDGEKVRAFWTYPRFRRYVDRVAENIRLQEIQRRTFENGDRGRLERVPAPGGEAELDSRVSMDLILTAMLAELEPEERAGVVRRLRGEAYDAAADHASAVALRMFMLRRDPVVGEYVEQWVQRTEAAEFARRVPEELRAALFPMRQGKPWTEDDLAVKSQETAVRLGCLVSGESYTPRVQALTGRSEGTIRQHWRRQKQSRFHGPLGPALRRLESPYPGDAVKALHELARSPVVALYQVPGRIAVRALLAEPLDSHQVGEFSARWTPPPRTPWTAVAGPNEIVVDDIALAGFGSDLLTLLEHATACARWHCPRRPGAARPAVEPLPAVRTSGDRRPVEMVALCEASDDNGCAVVVHLSPAPSRRWWALFEEGWPQARIDGGVSVPAHRANQLTLKQCTLYEAVDRFLPHLATLLEQTNNRR